MQELAWAELAEAEQALLAAARAAAERAYAPYSGFHVGAALAPLAGGAPVVGANVENAAYPSGLCAERAALVHANAVGHRRFRALAICARASQRRPDGGWDLGAAVPTARPTAPCGACRQMLWEAASLGDGDLTVLMADTALTTVWRAPLSELLPLAFGPRDLA